MGASPLPHANAPPSGPDSASTPAPPTVPTPTIKEEKTGPSAPPPPPPPPPPASNEVASFDPETAPKDLKKEGSDWMTMFNPNVKRVLDVGLVHTLVHDS